MHKGLSRGLEVGVQCTCTTFTQETGACVLFKTKCVNLCTDRLSRDVSVAYLLPQVRYECNIRKRTDEKGERETESVVIVDKQ